MRAFADPFALTEQDRVEDGEQRWQTLGVVEGYFLILAAQVSWDEDEDACRSKSFASFRPDPPIERKGDAMSKKIVEHSIDLANLPPLSEKQKAELSALAARPDGEIDYSEIPPLTEEFWKNAIRGRFYKPIKTSTTVRIDSDVLAWLRAQGKGYQSRINAILRREMLSSLKR